MSVGEADISTRELLALARSAANKVHDSASTPARRLNLCRQLLETPRQKELSSFYDIISKLDTSAHHYWIGTFYALLLPPEQRRNQAVYFTPPRLAESLVGLAAKVGFDMHRHTAIDPAAGGAAFLSTLASKMRSANVGTNSILKRLRGIEIDPGLARLAEILIGEQLKTEFPKASVVKNANSLNCSIAEQFDLVVANPPYGRLSLDKVPTSHWQNVCHSGHINKYALFTELCFRLVKPGGLIALVLPSSFIAGPLYDLLRTFIRSRGQIAYLGSVARRNDMFADVAQDVSAIVIKAGAEHKSSDQVSLGHFVGGGIFKAVTAARLPSDVAAPWPVVTSTKSLIVGGSTFEDYGAKLRAGYFVWNREIERMRNRRYGKFDFPLVWAKNIRAGRFCVPAARRRQGIDFVKFDSDNHAIVRKQALVVQRTTNSAQPRRLIAARISPSVLKRWGGFVSENHTLVVTAPDIATLKNLCLLLNSHAVDRRYRQLSGTASISVQLLRSLDLPSPSALSTALRSSTDFDAAIEQAYVLSANERTKATA